jgi:hypothetical protein
MKMPIAYLDVAARSVELAPHVIFRTPTVANLGSPVGLYLEQPWVGRTDEEIDGMVEVTDLSGAYYYDDLLALARAIEAKLREKNA